MKNIVQIILIVVCVGLACLAVHICLAIGGCGSVNNTNDFKVGDTVYVFDSGYLPDGLYTINESDGSGQMPYKINRFWIHRENVTLATPALKQALKRLDKTEELTVELESLQQRTKSNQEIIQLLLDYYGVKIKYISEHMELVPETGN